jgi:hypothetical protein
VVAVVLPVPRAIVIIPATVVAIVCECRVCLGVFGSGRYAYLATIEPMPAIVKAGLLLRLRIAGSLFASYQTSENSIWSAIEEQQ